MENQTPQRGDWAVMIGTYPGVLVGARTYREADSNVHVLYLPFVDIAFQIWK